MNGIFTPGTSLLNSIQVSLTCNRCIIKKTHDSQIITATLKKCNCSANSLHLGLYCEFSFLNTIMQVQTGTRTIFVIFLRTPQSMLMEILEQYATIHVFSVHSH